MLFDLLWLDGHSTMELPYEERRTLLLGLEPQRSVVADAAPRSRRRCGDDRREQAFGLEGVVAKRLELACTSPGAGRATWLKVKNQLRQEFVVGGWQPGESGRTGSIGSLLVGYYDGDGRCTTRARSGAGFGPVDRRARTALRAAARARRRARSTCGAPPKGVRFVEPMLVVEVRFTEWTSAGNIRQPTFLGLRTDKDPREVVREVPQ